jgi:type IV secretory pathway VirJ component
MGFSERADFQIRVTGWLGLKASSAALPTLHELSRIEARKVQCFYGADERDSACTILVGKGTEVIKTGGGHHFGGDYASLAERIIQGLAHRS